MIEEFLTALVGAGVEIGWREAADALWLAEAMTVRPSASPHSERVPAPPLARPSTPASTPPMVVPAPSAAPVVTPSLAQLPRTAPPAPPLPLVPYGTTRAAAGDTLLAANTPVRSPLPEGLGIGRALRRFGRRRPSPTARRNDVEATIARYCETRVLAPVTVPALEEWFRDVVLVVDGGASMVVWRETLRAFAALLKRHHAFGRVTRLSVTGDAGRVRVATAAGSEVRPREIVHPTRRQLVLVVTDGTGPLWLGQAMRTVLRDWGRAAPLVLIQMLAPRQWPATALGEADVSVVPTGRGTPNSRLRVQPSWWWAEDRPPEHAAPIIGLHARAFDTWARMVMAGDRKAVPAVLTAPQAEEPGIAGPIIETEPRGRVEMFLATVSHAAARLATLLSAVEVTLPVAELLLDTLVPGGRPVHLAEVLASGLLHGLPPAGDRSGGPRYEFEPGMRSVLQEALTTTDTFAVWRVVAPYLELATDRPAPFSRLVTSVEAIRDVEHTRLAEIAADLIERMGLRPDPSLTGVLPARSAAAVIDQQVDDALRDLGTRDTHTSQADPPRPESLLAIADVVVGAPFVGVVQPALFTLSCHHDISQLATALLKRTRAPQENQPRLVENWRDWVVMPTVGPMLHTERPI